jgi:protein-S-isoprenylcysteine O-methyltransferase Ste14
MHDGFSESRPQRFDKELTMSTEISKPKIYPPVWVVLTMLAMYALHRWLPIMVIDIPFASILAGLALILGLLMILMAAAGFNRAKTGVVPFSESTKLVKTGLYRFTRNPMYLGMVMILSGFAFALGSLAAWIPIPIFITIIQLRFILKEERFLTEIYGDDYVKYIKQVRRWL